MARRRWKRGPVVVERVCGGAAGAVDGGVVDAGEADGLGGVAEEASDGGIAGAGRLGDEEVRAVAFGDAVGLGANRVRDRQFFPPSHASSSLHYPMSCTVSGGSTPVCSSHSTHTVRSRVRHAR